MGQEEDKKDREYKKRVTTAYGSGAMSPKDRDRARREAIRKFDPDMAAKLDEIDAGTARLSRYTDSIKKSTDATEKSTARLNALAGTPDEPKKKAKSNGSK